MLRASGVPWDLRKVDHYECYDDFDWQVAWEKEETAMPVIGCAWRKCASRSRSCARPAT